VRVTMRRDYAVSREVDVDLSISAEGRGVGGSDDVFNAGGYVPQSVPLRFLGGESAVRADVRLSRAATVGNATLTYEISDPDGRPVDLSMYVELNSTTGRSIGGVAFPKLEQIVAGKYAAKIPPGEWRLVLRLHQPLQNLVTREDRLTLAAGEQKSIAAVFPHTGKVAVKWPWSHVQSGWIVGLHAATGTPSYSESTPRQGSLEFIAVPVGRWTIAIAPAGSKTPPFTREFEVTAGSSQTIDFTR